MNNTQYTEEFIKRVYKEYEVLEANVDRKDLGASSYQLCCKRVHREMKEEFPGHTLDDEMLIRRGVGSMKWVFD